MKARTTTSALVFALAMTTAACGAGRTAIPWKDERPAILPPPALAVPCRARDLNVSLSLGGALGSVVGHISARNVSHSPCSLVGFPSVTFAGDSPKPRIGHGLPEDPDPWARPRASSLRAMPPGKTALARMQWDGWCGPSPTILVTVTPGSAPFRFRARSTPTCFTHGGRPYVLLSRWWPAPSATVRLPLRVELIPASPPAYYSKPGVRYVVYGVRRGDVLQYAVRLVNTSRRPFRFRRCPIYEELTPDAMRPAAYVLNCRPAKTIAPGGYADFEMQTPAPAERSGDLVWWLPQDPRATSPTAVIDVRPR